MPSGITYVTTIDLNGPPTEPPEARKAFKCACGFQVKDNVSITIQDWRLVPETTKEQLWRNIIFPRMGLFQSDRENEQLNASLSNPKHIGHIHDIGSQMPWKHGFLKDSTSYKKHDRYKKTLE
jgi:hypothetical protein